MLRCDAPPHVLADLADGDLTVRRAHDGRFVAGAAVGYDHPDVAGYWTGGCTPD